MQAWAFNKAVINRLLFSVSLLLLFACSDQPKPAHFEAQKNHFLSAIQQVQKAGQLLQQKQLKQSEIQQAMLLLDNTMMDANSVEAGFLKWLDKGLYQAFSAYLIKGIESYRFGVELGEPDKQAQGIALLQRWWHYWQLKKPAVLEKLNS